MPKANEKTQDKPTQTADNNSITLSGNAAKMANMKKQHEKMMDEMAGFVAVEVVGTLEGAIKDAEQSTAFEIPTPNGNYLTAKMASAGFMALRDELTSAYIRCENIQADKAILLQRKAEKSFRSDVEAAACERSLGYYESLDERLQEVTTLISDFVKVHTLACEAQHTEDLERQADVAPDDRTFTTMPELRWVSSADKTADPSGWEHTNDVARVTQQAKFWLNYNT